MGRFQQDPLLLISSVATFALVAALCGAVAILLKRRDAKRDRRIQDRLDPNVDRLDSQRTLRLWHEGEQATVTVTDFLEPRSLRERLNWLQKDAGYSLPMTSIFAMVGGSAMALALLTFLLTGMVFPGVALGAVVCIAFWLVLGRRIAKRTALFERQLVDGLELSARALRAGHPMLGSFQLIAQEVPEPVGSIFAEICQMHQMGLSLEEALTRTAVLSRNPDMRLFSASLAIQMRTGGNLADVVEGIAAVIRQRMRLNRRFRVLTAQTQMSKRILLAMPLVVTGAMQIISPTYLNPLFEDRVGRILLLIAVSMLLMGWYVMNRMASLKS